MSISYAPAGKSGKWDGALDWLQMLSGVSLILFMWCHMLLVSSVVISPALMNGIAYFFEMTGMAQVGGPLIFLVFLTHFVLAARKIPFRFDGQKTIWQHARMMHHADTWLWVVQVVSAMLILVMGSIHMWVVLTDLPITAAKSAARIQGGFWAVFYLFLLPLAELHVGIGFYRIGVKWGFVKDRERGKFKRGENMITLMFICIGLITLIRFMFLSIN
ncbi:MULTISPECIES: succinate dehydrogenase/fumarate reductase cytochrome b subunit [unclassified Pseudodesulfovibrio]|uniref:succinate dehydrogenase/fumarate reductase cytochrome b subunit n=1 Tax=unclassified Pseudodesulfovibrio TaxID=2661612 RepID=UPI000FEB9632|nr:MULTISPECIES: succinate dehydrogenase/fumarate reductase cytochrome b subunit [unclassified Pseudodesulfovibrio]MCJ2164194.1 succinate dehydrogenase/fumarate reductase cytochrome b subunit [Pseudodesulfovibrio sp. S3-i]RWU05182.1 succinate dehydrogenase/fumarate reductase cytochrome b subunit [Pseudodesulfovibrio sp. S3]